MKKALATAVLSATMVLGGAATADAATLTASYTGNVFAVGYDSTALNPYKVGLTSYADRWFYMLSDTRIYRCSGVGIAEGNLINLSNLNKLKNNFKKVRLDYYSGYRDSITCL